MRILHSLKLFLIPVLLVSCAIQSAELIPCMCDDKDETLGIMNCMCEPGKKKPVKRISYIQDEKPVYEDISITEEVENAYTYLHKSRNMFAPVQLEYVDFRIKKGRKYDEFDTKLGNYRFRIFGCRRESKNVFLNQGRAMQKNMHFFDIFFENMNEYYPVVVEKNNPYWVESDQYEYPEYILTAEINDYFMNICDEFDWDKVKKKNLRTGSSEITITWRLLDISKENVFCKTTTTGYGEIVDGEYNGETLLVERAFADALNKLPQTECFNQQLTQRVDIRKIKAQRRSLMKVKRNQSSFRRQYERELLGIEAMQDCSARSSRKVRARSQTPIRGIETSIYDEGCTRNKIAKINSSGNVKSRGDSEIERTLTADEKINKLGVIDENGGSSSKGNSPFEKTGITNEDGGSSSKGSNIDTDGDLSSKSSASSETLVIDINDLIFEDGGSSSKGSNIEDEGDMKSSGLFLDKGCQGVEIGDESCTLIRSMQKEQIKLTDDFWLEVPLGEESSKTTVENRKTAEDIYSSSKNKFCIAKYPPYQTLSPENLYRVRASVVEVNNPNGKKGAGLIIADQLVLTSADLLDKSNNNFRIKTINNIEFKGNAFRVNPNKNVALILLDEKVRYTPLPLSLELPEVGKDIFMTLGLLNQDEGEGYLDNQGKITGYRYSEEKGAEIIVDTFVQNYTLGGALIDKHGNIVGLAHSGKKLDDSPDLFIPIETALKGLGVDICGVAYSGKKPVQLKAIEKPVSTYVEISGSVSKEPKALNKKERK